MPDMTKEDPQEQTGAAPELCVRCGHAHKEHEHALVPGSRSWFWVKRIENMMLWVAPGGPLLMGTMQVVNPSVTVNLNDQQELAVNGVYDMPGRSASTVERVTVYLDDPTIGDRLIAAGPALMR